MLEIPKKEIIFNGLKSQEICVYSSNFKVYLIDKSVLDELKMQINYDELSILPTKNEENKSKVKFKILEYLKAKPIHFE